MTKQELTRDALDCDTIELSEALEAVAREENRKDDKQNLVEDERGASFIEKLIIIGMFIFVVAAGIQAVAGSAQAKLTEQSSAISGVKGTL